MSGSGLRLVAIFDYYITIMIKYTWYKLLSYFLTQQGIQTLLIFLFKQICVFIYHQIDVYLICMKLKICTIGNNNNNRNCFTALGSRKNHAFTISNDELVLSLNYQVEDIQTKMQNHCIISDRNFLNKKYNFNDPETTQRDATINFNYKLCKTLWDNAF